MEQHSLDAVNKSGFGLRVEFFRQDNRWAHRVVVVQDAAKDVLLESCEGDDEQTFPPSPALQQADFRAPAEMPAVGLLLGMAGRNHWSLSVQAYPIERRLVFDAACACPYETDVRLGTAYALKTPWSIGTCGRVGRGQRLQLNVDLPSGLQCICCGSAESGSDVTVCVDERNRHLVMRPTEDNWPGTVRWQYQIQLGSVGT